VALLRSIKSSRYNLRELEDAGFDHEKIKELPE
jgi:hypothetical protein